MPENGARRRPGGLISTFVFLTSVAAADTEISCTAAYKRDVCPLHCTGTIANMCCANYGQTAVMMTVPSPWHARAVTARVDQFQRCTGGEIRLEQYIPDFCRGEGFCGGFAGLFEVGLGALEDAKGASVYDAYMTQAMDVPLLSEFVEDLVPRIRDAPELRWGDVMAQVRRANAVGSKQAAMPFDFDFVNYILRSDLVALYAEETGRPEPRTFEELADFGEYFMGRDLNADGEPDFGFCALNGAGPAGPQAMLMSVAAAKLQYLGTEQGSFFDPSSKDAEPLVDNPAFREALELTRRVWMASLDSEPGGWVFKHETAWLEGRCAVYNWLSGSVSLVTNMRDVGRCDGPCEGGAPFVWQPTKPDGTYMPPRRVFPPGSETVYVRELGEMRRCTAEIGEGVDEDTHVHCPHLDAARDERGGAWINRVPYFYSAYQHASVSINAGAPTARRDLIWAFAVFANTEALGVVSQNEGPTYLDPFRRSHLDEEAERWWLPPWTRANYEDMRATLLWAGSSANVLPGLALDDRDGFEYALEKLLWQYFLEVAPCADHVACKCASYEGGIGENPNCGYGWGDFPNASMWARARAGHASLDEDGVVSALVDEYRRVGEKAYGAGPEGRLAMANAYRESIGLPRFASEHHESSSKHKKRHRRLVKSLYIAAGVVAGALLLAALVVGGRAVRRTYAKARTLEIQTSAVVEKQCDEARNRIRNFQAPFVAVPASVFVELGGFQPHEQLRDENKLTFVDSVKDDFFNNYLTVFVSHQWLGRDHPDPKNAQYKVVCVALRDVAKQSGRPMAEIYVWLDFLSIPQRCKAVQRLNIFSLPCIASSVDVFVVAAPKATHAFTGEACDAATYRARTWCRAEIFAHCARRGVDVMFYATEKGLRPMFPKLRWRTPKASARRLPAPGGDGDVTIQTTSTKSVTLDAPAGTTAAVAGVPASPPGATPSPRGAPSASFEMSPSVAVEASPHHSPAKASSLLSPPRIPRCAPCGEQTPEALAAAETFRSCLDVIHGQLTCCGCRHPAGQPCDREELVLPIMGLFAEIYQNRRGETRDIYDALMEGGSVEYYFPKTFEYETPFGQVLTRPLFGDLPRAMMDLIDREQGLHEKKRTAYVIPGADTRREAPPLEDLPSRTRTFARPRFFRQQTLGSHITTSSRATSRHSLAYVADHSDGASECSPTSDGRGLEESRTNDSRSMEKRRGLARLASAPLDAHSSTESLLEMGAAAERALGVCAEESKEDFGLP